MAAEKTSPILDMMPIARGRYEADADLANMVWFRTGGPADVLFRPADEADLCSFLRNLPNDIPVHVIGVGSNVLVRDHGVRGVVIKLGKPFSEIKIEGETITAGAGAMDVTVAFAAAEASLSGLEFLRGIPGTVGGALRMNAGAYGAEVSDVLVSARAVDRLGEVHEISADEMGFSYRKTAVRKDWIFTSATFRGTPGDKTKIEAAMNGIQQAREDTQPMRVRTGGSTFKNPDGMKAWQLIDEAGCRGMKVGGAMVSEKHCNFLINTGGATSSDLEKLGEDVRKKVKASSGVDLVWEIEKLGDA